MAGKASITDDDLFAPGVVNLTVPRVDKTIYGLISGCYPFSLTKF